MKWLIVVLLSLLMGCAMTPEQEENHRIFYSCKDWAEQQSPYQKEVNFLHVKCLKEQGYKYK